MKKLMIAAAIVCAAAWAQASQYSWTVANVGAGFDNPDNSAIGTAYLFADAGDTTRAAILAAVEGGTFKADDWAYLDSTELADGQIGPKATASGLTNYKSQDMFVVCVANAEGDWMGGQISTVPQDYAFVTTSVTLGSDVPDVGAYTVEFPDQYDASIAGGAWAAQTGAVPEPTSGLLLLLGVAGIALRRRRA